MEDNARGGRVSLDEAVYSLVVKRSAELNIAIEDLVESTLLAGLGGEDHQAVQAQRFLERIAGDIPTMTKQEIAAAVSSSVPGMKPVGIRLGGRVDFVQTSPFPRSSHGADYAEVSSPRLWAATRGNWNVSDESNSLVAYRAGEPLAFYVNILWSAKDPETKRRWATYGLEVTEDGRCIDPESGEVVRAVTPDEMTARGLLFSHRLEMPPAARNPIVRLWD